MNRRQFLRYGCVAATMLPMVPALNGCGAEAGNSGNSPELKEAMFWEEGENNTVRCQLCFRSCNIPSGSTGACGVRLNSDGVLYSMVMGNMASVTFGPVEKKPLHHYLPGATANNYGTAGCNLRCRFCHNWHLSQKKLEELDRYQTLTPEEAVERAKSRNAALISFTYNEPTVFYEFVLRTATLAKEEGLGVNVNTNAMLNEGPLRKLLEVTDCTTVDLKGFSEDFYREICGGSLQPVLRNIKIMKEAGILVEVVNLVIPGLNDSNDYIRNMCEWLAEEAGTDTPLHLNRFTPAYKLTDISSTPVSRLESAHDIAREEGLKYVYIGNVPGHTYNSTFCPECGEKLIDRHHFSIRGVGMENGKCSGCGLPIPGVWDNIS